jgi:hypothetical protein
VAETLLRSDRSGVSCQEFDIKRCLKKDGSAFQMTQGFKLFATVIWPMVFRIQVVLFSDEQLNCKKRFRRTLGILYERMA